MRLGKLLVGYRLRRRISQETLAALLDLDRSYISRVESGQRGISVETLKRISKRLRIPLEDIL